MSVHHWKILFVEEWTKVWEMGLKKTNQGSGPESYDAVYDSKNTLDICEAEIDGFQSDWDSDDDDDWYW